MWLPAWCKAGGKKVLLLNFWSNEDPKVQLSSLEKLFISVQFYHDIFHIFSSLSYLLRHEVISVINVIEKQDDSEYLWANSPGWGLKIRTISLCFNLWPLLNHFVGSESQYPGCGFCPPATKYCGKSHRGTTQPTTKEPIWRWENVGGKFPQTVKASRGFSFKHLCDALSHVPPTYALITDTADDWRGTVVSPLLWILF